MGKASPGIGLDTTLHKLDVKLRVHQPLKKQNVQTVQNTCETCPRQSIASEGTPQFENSRF